MNATPSSSSEMPRPDGNEPKALFATGPIVLIFVLFFGIFYWGAIYVDEYGGGFNPHVYSPYASIKDVEKLQPKKSGNELAEKGKQIYASTCAVCHQENGMGSAANGCPPLAGSEWVNGTPARLVRIISKGLTGPIEVKGQPYGTGTMPNIGDSLQGDEKQKAESIAAIASYIRSQWGNKAPAVKPADAAKIRDEIKDKASSFTAPELEQVQ
jgi:mono/diheme cytochrome c family protein